MREHLKIIRDFFNRDISSFFKSSASSRSSDADLPGLLENSGDYSIAQTQPLASGAEIFEDHSLPDIPLLLNPEALDIRVFKRKILDWKDSSIFSLVIAAQDANGKFSLRIDYLLYRVPLWRNAIPISADKVLRSDFHAIVFSTIKYKLFDLIGEFNKIVKNQKNYNVDLIEFKIKSFETPRPLPLKFGFKSSNRDVILNEISGIVFGRQGLVDKYADQISSISKNFVGDFN